MIPSWDLEWDLHQLVVLISQASMVIFQHVKSKVNDFEDIMANEGLLNLVTFIMEF